MDNPAPLSRPIRVVVFGGGPTIDRGALQLIDRLEQHPEIEFLGAFCQSASQSLPAIIQDRWRRRRLLAVPLLLAELASWLGRLLFRPRAELAFRRQLARHRPRLHYVPDLHAPSVLDRVRGLQPDLGLVYGSPILRPELFTIPARGTLGIHHGKSPEYRGKKTTFWEMYNDEPTAGVTIQKINSRLDGGDIVKQGAVPIGRRSLARVWQALEALGLELYLEAILDVKNGVARYRPVAGRAGKLYRDPKLRDLLLFYWRRARAALRS